MISAFSIDSMYDRPVKSIAGERNCFLESDDILPASQRSDRPIQRCHNSVGQGMRSVEVESLSLKVTQKIGTGEPMRILLVEDDLDLAQFIRKGLKEEQYAVDFAADGEEGLALALGILTIF